FSAGDCLLRRRIAGRFYVRCVGRLERVTPLTLRRMQLCRRQLQPGETDHELLWLIVSVTSLAIATAWFAVGLPWPICMFHELTGLPASQPSIPKSTAVQAVAP